MRCRSVACTEASSRSEQLLSRMAHMNIGTLVLLPRGTIYPGTLKHYLVVSVQENYPHILAHPAKNGNDCLLAAGHSSPVQSGWGLAPRIGKQGMEEVVILSC